jgi:hypothetical protein
MRTYSDDELAHHHARCHKNKERIEAATQCGCFQCLEIFPANEVTAYIDHAPSGDAHCPKCGTDSVIADDGIEPFNAHLLAALKERYFEREIDWKKRLGDSNPNDAQAWKYEFIEALKRTATSNSDQNKE